MRTLFFDTETSGLPINYKAPVTDLGNWPRLVQIGWIVYDDDGKVLNEVERIVRPEGFEISETVAKIHGITQEKAIHSGIPLSYTLASFESDLTQCEVLVGHNLSFDMSIMGAEYLRACGRNPMETRITYDTMLKGTNLCKLPGNRLGSYKWPKLKELYEFLFHEPLAQTHTALDDIRNTAKCYFEMKRLGVM